MNDETEIDIRYALAKCIPAMSQGFSIETSYGSVQVDAEDAAQIIKATEAMLNKKLKRLS